MEIDQNSPFYVPRLPQSKSSSIWVIAVNNDVYPFSEFVYIKYLVQMLFALLCNLQNTKSNKIVPEKYNHKC